MDRVTFCFRRGLDVKGRAARQEFWSWTLFVALAGAVALAADEALGLVPHDGNPFELDAGGPLSVATALLLSVPSVAVSVRRLHDSNRRWWWLPMPVGAIVVVFAITALSISWEVGEKAQVGLGLTIIAVLLGGWVWLLVLFCLEGTRGPNRFGPDPKDPAGVVDLSKVFR